MYKAGYDPTAFIDFFEKMTVLERKGRARFGSSFVPIPISIRGSEPRRRTFRTCCVNSLLCGDDFGIQRREATACGEPRPPQGKPRRRGADALPQRAGGRRRGCHSGEWDERPTLETAPVVHEALNRRLSQEGHVFDSSYQNGQHFHPATPLVLFFVGPCDCKKGLITNRGFFACQGEAGKEILYVETKPQA